MLPELETGAQILSGTPTAFVSEDSEGWILGNSVDAVIAKFSRIGYPEFTLLV